MTKITNASGVPEDEFMREGLIDRLTQYLEAEPGAWHVRYNLAVALMHDDRLDEALQQFSQVLAQAPKHMESLVNIGGIHLSRGDADEALKAFTKALSVWDVPMVRANLAVAYLQLGKVEEGARQLERALEVNPDMPDALTNLGAAYIRLGQLEQAAEVSRKALELAPDFAMAHNNLAVVLQEQGDLAAAAEHATRAVELGYPVHENLLGKLGIS